MTALIMWPFCFTEGGEGNVYFWQAKFSIIVADTKDNVAYQLLIWPCIFVFNTVSSNSKAVFSLENTKG